MSAESVWFLGSQIVLIINIITLFIALHRKYGLLFSISMFALIDLILFSFLIITGETPGATRSLTGFAFLPVVILLFGELLFQKVFAVFLVLQLTVGLTSLSAGIADLFALPGGGEYSMTHFTAALLLLIVYFVLVYKYGRVVLKKLFEHGSQTEWAIYSLGAVFSYAVMLLINNRFTGMEKIFMLLFILWGFVILCHTIINTHERVRQKYNADFAASIISSGREYYRKMDEMYDTLRIQRHDYKYHLSTVRELANAGDTEAIKKYLAEVQSQAPENELRAYCNNSVINALLAGYADRCAKNNVRFDVLLDLPETLTVPNYEICIILGNLLENAAEACEKLTHNAVIELAVKTQGTHLVIMVKNSFEGNIKEENGQPASTKKDGGFGLRSVRAVSARYDGHILTEWDAETFTIYVMVTK